MTKAADDSAVMTPLGFVEPKTAQEAVNDMVEAGLFDHVVESIDEGGLQLTGEGEFLPEIVKAVLERGLKAELTEHLGYEHDERAGRVSGNARNGSTPKTVLSEVGEIELDTPRDRAGSFEPRGPATR